LGIVTKADVMTVPIVLSWSGGKDSSLALAALRRDPRYEVLALLTSVTREYDRVSIHGVRRSLLEAQARALDLPLHEITLDAASSYEAYEAAFRRAAEALRLVYPTLRQLAFGDLYLADVRAYRDRLAATADMEGVYPLWGLDPSVLAKRFIAEGYRAHLVCVDTHQIAAHLAGAPYDEALLAELPSSADPCGEGGEFHTFVWDGPIFRVPVPVVVGERVLRNDRFAYCDLLPASAEGGEGAEAEGA
jgi:uncharacterized protein (TIGR00290 family)